MTTPLLEAIAWAMWDRQYPWATGKLPCGDQAYLELARAALSALKQQASDNDGFLDIGDGLVICRNKEPEALTDDEPITLEEIVEVLKRLVDCIDRTAKDAPNNTFEEIVVTWVQDDGSPLEKARSLLSRLKGDGDAAMYEKATERAKARGET